MKTSLLTLEEISGLGILRKLLVLKTPMIRHVLSEKSAYHEHDSLPQMDKRGNFTDIITS